MQQEIEVRFMVKCQRGRAILPLVFVILASVLEFCPAQSGKGQKNEKNVSDNNTLCYTCHLGLQDEEITAKHAVEGVTCTSCHGPSVEHMHDEMQVTKPDRLFGRGEVDSMCRMCHEGHKDIKNVEAFRKKWLGKTRLNGRLITKTSICTDCHGTHNYIAQNAKIDPAKSDWISLFNGRNLKGWEVAGDSSWSVKAARLAAVPDTSKPRNAIITAHEYADFQISITFRADWPVNARVSLRQLEHISGPYVAIFDSAKPVAQPGSLWLPDKKLALANLRQNVVERLTWNTLLIEAREDEYSTWLNKMKVGSVQIDGPSKGKIAIDIADHPENKQSRLEISEIYIRSLDEPSEKRDK
jgi:hypothetical protein